MWWQVAQKTLAELGLPPVPVIRHVAVEVCHHPFIAVPSCAVLCHLMLSNAFHPIPPIPSCTLFAPFCSAPRCAHCMPPCAHSRHPVPITSQHMLSHLMLHYEGHALQSCMPCTVFAAHLHCTPPFHMFPPPCDLLLASSLSPYILISILLFGGMQGWPACVVQVLLHLHQACVHSPIYIAPRL